MSIESHLEKYFGVANKEDVAELILDSVTFSEIKENEKKSLERYSGVLVFSMNNCGLRILNNLPSFGELETLDLNDNKIKGEELTKVVIYKNLAKLRLSNNPITCLESLKVLSQLKHLEILDLVDCPITNVENYREEVYKLLPKLQVLDMLYKDGALYESEDEDEDFEEGEEGDEDFIDEELDGSDYEEELGDDDEDEEAGPSKKRKIE